MNEETKNFLMQMFAEQRGYIDGRFKEQKDYIDNKFVEEFEKHDSKLIDYIDKKYNVIHNEINIAIDKQTAEISKEIQDLAIYIDKNFQRKPKKSNSKIAIL